jgi:hypothetical protein
MRRFIANPLDFFESLGEHEASRISIGFAFFRTFLVRSRFPPLPETRPAKAARSHEFLTCGGSVEQHLSSCATVLVLAGWPQV